MNVKKTKEVIFDFRLKDNVHSNILIKGQEVERVKEYKYLGVVFDEKLDWSKNSITIQKKINQRLFFMKKLFSFNVDKTLLNLFYDSCIVSLFTFCINAWGGNQRANDKAKMNRTIRNANKFLNNCNYNQVDDWLVLSCRRKLNSILADTSHPINSFLRTSPRSGRLLHITTKTNRHFNSFLPLSVRNS